MGTRRWARIALAVSASALAAGVVVQVFLAGLGTFVAPGWWARHRDFVHAFEWASPLALVLAYVARARRRTKGLAWASIALLTAQYTTAGQRGLAGRHSLAALHPVGAMLLFWVAAELARAAWRDARGIA